MTSYNSRLNPETPRRSPEIEELTNPDVVEEERTYGWTDQFLQRILGAMIFEPRAADQCQSLVKPSYFRHEAHRFICRLIQDHFAKYGQPPDKPLLECQIIDKIEDPADRAAYLAELDTICDYEPLYQGVRPLKEILDQVAEFGKTQALRAAYYSTVDLFDSKKPDKWEKIWATLDEARAVGQTASSSMTPLDPFAPDFLDGENTEWLVERFIQRGQLMILGAKSKAGKSLLKLWLVHCLLHGKPFLGGATSGPVPILYLDFEQSRSYFLHWLTMFVGEEDRAVVSRYLNYFTKIIRPDNLGTLPLYVTTEWIKAACEATMKHKSYDTPGIILIDTFRPAFLYTPGLEPNFENSPDAIGRLLRPLQEFCHTSGWTLIMSHHTNKNGVVSGSTEFWAAADTVCRFDRDVEHGSNVCEFSLDGRLFEPIEKRIMTFDDDRFVYRGSANEYEKAKQSRKDRDDYLLTASHIVGVMDEDKEYRTNEIVAELKGIAGRDRVYRAIETMLDGEIISKTGYGYNTRYRRFVDSVERLQLQA